MGFEAIRTGRGAMRCSCIAEACATSGDDLRREVGATGQRQHQSFQTPITMQGPQRLRGSTLEQQQTTPSINASCLRAVDVIYIYTSHQCNRRSLMEGGPGGVSMKRPYLCIVGIHATLTGNFQDRAQSFALGLKVCLFIPSFVLLRGHMKPSAAQRRATP